MHINSIHETIKVPPHMPWLDKAYIKAKQLEKRLNTANNIYNLVSDAALIESRYFPHRLRNETQYFTLLENHMKLPYEFKKRLEHKYDLISNRIDTFKRMAQDKTLNRNRLASWYEYINIYDECNPDELDEWIDNFESLKNRQYSNKTLLYCLKNDYIDDEQYETLRDAILITQSVYEYLIFAKNIADNIKTQFSRAQYTNERDMPPHDPVETLYHATPFVREILTDGFKTKEQLGTEVLGGATENAISFTADINIANAIVDALKDVIKIANNTLKLGELVGIARAENLDIKDFDNFLSKFRDYKRKGKTVDPQITFEFYKHYLMVSPVRYNPVFFGVTIDNFKGLKENNVGVLAADVEMSKVINYLYSMEEFRVPLDAINNVRKI